MYEWIYEFWNWSLHLNSLSNESKNKEKNKKEKGAEEDKHMKKRNTTNYQVQLSSNMEKDNTIVGRKERNE